MSTMTASDIHLVRDLSLENWFTENNINFEWVEDYNLSTVDEQKSLKVQSRVETRDSGVVASYASMMKAGDRFPAIVVLKGVGLDTVPAGLHRFGALKECGVERCSVYLLPEDTDPDFIQELAVRTNTVHGRDLSPSELAIWAKKYSAQGYSTERVASILNVARSRAAVLVRTGKAQDRYTRLGGTATSWAKINQSTANLLYGIGLDDFFKPMTDLCAKHQPNTQIVKASCQALSEASSFEEKTMILEDFKTSASGKKANKPGSNGHSSGNREKLAWHMAKMHLTAVNGLTGQAVVDSLKPGDMENREQIRELAMRVKDVCHDIMELLDNEPIS